MTMYSLINGKMVEMDAEAGLELKATQQVMTASLNPVNADAVDAEREARINAGFVFGGVHYDSNADARENIAGAYSAALTAVTIGVGVEGNLRWNDPDKDFEWIAHDNSYIPMDAPTVMKFGQAAMRWKQQHIFAARTIKDMTPIPEDFADDARWP